VHPAPIAFVIMSTLLSLIEFHCIWLTLTIIQHLHEFFNPL
jgi:hypothetical protein